MTICYTWGGTAVLNTYAGPYTAGPGDEFQVGALGMTHMAGPPDSARVEGAYFALLKQARTYRVAPDSLRLYDGNGNDLLIFSAVSK